LICLPENEKNKAGCYDQKRNGSIMKILYIADRWNPKDHSKASGIDFEIYHSLLREGLEVEVVGPFDFSYSIPERAIKIIYSKFSDKTLSKYPFMYFLRSGLKVKQALRESKYDLVVSLYAAPLVFPAIPKPFLYFCDSTIHWIKHHWRSFSDLAYLTMGAWEQRVINKTDHIITFSEANKDVLSGTYGVPESDLTVFPIPASIPKHVIPGEIQISRDFDPVKLLLVGRDYHRKGVDIAVDIVQGLIQQGIPAELRIVGLDGENTESVKFMGLYDKTDPAELEGYVGNYRWAHFLLHPARFEAAGIVPSEAAAFGVPTLTNDSGGLATTVKDGVSGRVFPEDSPAELYIQEIKRLTGEPDLYHQLARSTNKRYHEELNWQAAGKKVVRIARSLSAQAEKSQQK
jgi:glycosyltransferase involved in cell wall biosynthesis